MDWTVVLQGQFTRNFCMFKTKKFPRRNFSYVFKFYMPNYSVVFLTKIKQI